MKPDILDDMEPEDCCLSREVLTDKCEGLISDCNFYVEIRMEPYKEKVVVRMKAVLDCLLRLSMDIDCCDEDGCRFYYEKGCRWLMKRACAAFLNLLNWAASECKFMSIRIYDGCYGRRCPRYKSAPEPKLLFLNVANKAVSLNEGKLIKVLHKVFYNGNVSGCVRIERL